MSLSQALTRIADPAPGRELSYLVLDRGVVIARAGSPDAAIGGAVARLRALIEQDAFGTVKVLDPAGRVLWRESATV